MKWIFTILLIHSCLSLKAQNGFINAYDFNHPSLVFSSMLLDNDTLVVTGMVIDDQPPYEQGIFFAKMDTLGQLITLKKYFGENGNTYGIASYPSGLIKVEDGSGYILLSGYFQTGDGIAMKLNADGDLLWQKEYPNIPGYQDFFISAIEVEDGFLISGYQFPSFFESHLLILKIDHEGNKQWEQSYGESNKRDVLQSFFQEDDKFIISSYAFSVSGSDPDSNHVLKIMEIDGYGNIEWNWESEPSLEEIRMIGLTHMEDGSWVYGSMRGQEGGFQEPLWKQFKFVVRNEFFSFVKEVYYDDMDSFGDDFLNMVPLTDGDWLGIGANGESVALPIEAHAFGWMTRISNGLEGQPDLGDTLWVRNDLTFPDSMWSTGQYLHSAVELPSGNIIVGGYFSDHNASSSDYGLLIKVNQHGCTDPTDCIPTNLTFVKTPGKQKDQALKVFPNPVRHLLHFEHDQIGQWDEVELLDVNGTVVRKSSRNDAVLMAGLARGVYVLRLWKDGRFWTRKVVRQ